DGEPFRLNIHDFGPENIAYLHHFRPVRGIGVHTQHDQFTIDVVAVPEILNFNDVNELVQLFCHLLKDGVISAYYYRHPGRRSIICRRNIQAINVESAPTEHSGDPSKDAELVFNQNRYRVTHSKGEESSWETA